MSAWLRSGIVLGLLGVGLATYGCGGSPSPSSNPSDAGTAGHVAAAGEASEGGGGGQGSTDVSEGGSAGDGAGISLAGSAGSATCGETAVSSRQRPVNVVVLLDRSGSMTRPYSTDAPTTRWEVMRQALTKAVDSLTGDISVGLKLFPDNDEAETCSVTSSTLEVPVTPISDASALINAAIQAATPKGGTPIASAVDVVGTYLASDEGLSLEGDRVVLLATDGAPNCNAEATCDAEQCITNIENPSFTDNLCGVTDSATQCLDEATAEANIQALLLGGGDVPKARTIVVGIPGSDKPAYASVLQTLGAAGGLPNPDAELDYFAVDGTSGVDGLVQTLQAITKELIMSCTLELTETPPDTDLVNVTIDGEAVAQSGDDGWTLDANARPMTITLKGATCEQLTAQGADSIVVTYGCPTVIR